MRSVKLVLAFIGLTLGLSLAPAVAAPEGVDSTSYDLGVRDFPQPQAGSFAQMPIRLWGVLAAPAGPGPYPLVVIAHGAHGDNCPVIDDADTWPCFDQERRSDLGLAYLARRLAATGVVAVVPDVNAAYTGGWGESEGQEYRRFNQVIQATVQAVADASAGTTPIEGIDLVGKVDTDRIGVLGHSRGGHNMVKWAKKHPAVTSLFLLAPYDGGRRLPNLPTTVVTGTCDGDTHADGLAYAKRASKDPDHTARLVSLTVDGANHNFYNQTLAKADMDDGFTGKGCTKRERASAGQQQRWLADVAAAHFAASLVQPRVVADYLKPHPPRTVKIAGLIAHVQRY